MPRPGGIRWNSGKKKYFATIQGKKTPLHEDQEKAHLIAYLKGFGHASFSTVRKSLRDVVGVTISRGQLAQVIGKVTTALDGPYQELLQALPAEPRLPGGQFAYPATTWQSGPRPNCLRRCPCADILPGCQPATVPGAGGHCPPSGRPLPLARGSLLRGGKPGNCSANDAPGHTLMGAGPGAPTRAGRGGEATDC
jgi:hypothetical protein